MAIKHNNLKSISNNCELCKGELWNSDSKVRQESALKRFGVIPNDCVNGSGDICHCAFKR